ncbi:SARP family transcriptional regulator [Virgisporangium aliadipatigenens]|uniref:SARP family transcriptional regulator n=1 Tax=Virgisporangium aliadipatigenens TaxID=741659 RepID=A0A8J4DVS0_9ACTN|nr:BTAD domain-containing putative transcriptional regulator [Virgisporangium aliadipatigenens]GIJ52104.1 SARP family transcriptional regulator [Virgisporangium aliadipatigenens]
MLFRILGPVQIDADDGTTHTLNRRQERAVLALLLLRPGRVLPVERLCDLLWDGPQPATARRAVHNHVAAVRAALAAAGAGPDALVSRDGGYAVLVEPDDVDVHRMRRIVAQAREIGDPVRRARLLESAVALWRGPPLHNAASDRLRERIAPELTDAYLSAHEELASAGLALGRHDALAGTLGGLVATYPARERLAELAMLALYRGGRATEALDLFRRTRKALGTEVGTEPGPALADLHGRILRQDPTLDAAEAPRQLPVAPPFFTAREELLARLDAAVDPRRSCSCGARPAPGEAVCRSHDCKIDTEPPVVVVSGAGGVGKTALVVHWGRGAAGRFPDGQLFVDLRGYSHDPPVGPHEALSRFLRALGVPDGRIPVALDRAVALYRERTAGRRLLVVVDNAHAAADVLPLVPAGAGSAVVVTCREPLPGLGAHVPVEVLAPDGAVRLLAEIVGPERAAAEPEALAALADACAHLPLALRVAAAHLLVDPERGIAAHLAELRADRIGRLSVEGDAAASLRASLDLSYRALPAPARHLLAVLGLHPAETFCLGAVTSLAGAPLDAVRDSLRALVRAHFVMERPGGRFGMHDLVSDYAARHAHALGAAECAAARRRMIDHYLHTGQAIVLVLDPGTAPMRLQPPAPGVVCGSAADTAQALDYYDAEVDTLLSVVRFAQDLDLARETWQLVRLMSVYLERRGRWSDIVATHNDAAAAAERAGDLDGRARAYRGLAHTHDIVRRVHDRRGDHEAALRHAHAALSSYTRAGLASGRVHAMNAVGRALTRLGRHAEALPHCERALATAEEIGDVKAQAGILDTLATLRHRQGDPAAAISQFDRAVELYRAAGDPHDEAEALAHLGDAHADTGNRRAAREAWRRALSIVDGDHALATGLRERLA